MDWCQQRTAKVRQKWQRRTAAAAAAACTRYQVAFVQVAGGLAGDAAPQVRGLAEALVAAAHVQRHLGDVLAVRRGVLHRV